MRFIESGGGRRPCEATATESPLARVGHGAKSAPAMVAGRDELEGVPLVPVISTPFQQMTAASAVHHGYPRTSRRMARMVMR